MRIRRIEPEDAAALVELCAEHAAYERATYSPALKGEALRAILAERPAHWFGWFAELDRRIVGYATATIDYSTWSAVRYLHMDCLYVREGCRGRGIGRELFRSVVQFGVDLGLREMQWQTPRWNTEADRFYRRFGVRVSEKHRYTLAPLTHE